MYVLDYFMFAKHKIQISISTGTYVNLEFRPNRWEENISLIMMQTNSAEIIKPWFWHIATANDDLFPGQVVFLYWCCQSGIGSFNILILNLPSVTSIKSRKVTQTLYNLTPWHSFPLLAIFCWMSVCKMFKFVHIVNITSWIVLCSGKRVFQQLTFFDVDNS